MAYKYYKKYYNKSGNKPTEMFSKFSSNCRGGCGGRIKAGDKIKKNVDGIWVCAGCAGGVGQEEQFSAPYAIGARVLVGGERCNHEDAPACGCEPVDFCPPDFDENY